MNELTRGNSYYSLLKRHDYRPMNVCPKCTTGEIVKGICGGTAFETRGCGYRIGERPEIEPKGKGIARSRR